MTVTVDENTPEVSASAPASTRTSLVLLGTKGGPRPGGERAAPGHEELDDHVFLRRLDGFERLEDLARLMTDPSPEEDPHEQ